METIISTLLEQGGGYALAALCIILIKYIADQRAADAARLCEVERQRAEEAQRWADENRADKRLMLDVIERNTQAMTKLTAVVERRAATKKEPT